MLNRMALYAVSLSFAFALSGCRTGGEISSYLVLPDKELSASAIPAGTKTEKVYLKSIYMPDYLRRRELIRVVDGDRVTGISRARWAVDFEKSAKAVLDENLRQLLGDRYGCPRCATRSIVLRFQHFELDDDDRLQVQGICEESGVCGRRLRLSFELDASEYENPARAHGAALSKVAVLVGEWLCK